MAVTATIVAMLTLAKEARALTIASAKYGGYIPPYQIKHMSRPTLFKPYTHEELGIPKELQIGGFTVFINFDSSISNAIINPDENGRQLNPLWKTGVIGRCDFSNQRIDLWTGNMLYKPTRQRMIFTLLEEIEHFIFYCMQLQPKNLEQNVWLHANEHVVVSHTILLLQVLKQLEGVDFNL